MHNLLFIILSLLSLSLPISSPSSFSSSSSSRCFYWYVRCSASQVCFGRSHTVVLTQLGTVFTFINYQYGQCSRNDVPPPEGTCTVCTCTYNYFIHFNNVHLFLLCTCSVWCSNIIMYMYM